MSRAVAREDWLLAAHEALQCESTSVLRKSQAFTVPGRNANPIAGLLFVAGGICLQSCGGQLGSDTKSAPVLWCGLCRLVIVVGEGCDSSCLPEQSQPDTRQIVQINKAEFMRPNADSSDACNQLLLKIELESQAPALVSWVELSKAHCLGLVAVRAAAAVCRPESKDPPQENLNHRNI